MFYRDFTLALITFFIFPTAVVPILKIGRKMRKVTDNTQQELGSFTSQLTQIFQGIRVIKSCNMEHGESIRANNKIDKIFQGSIRQLVFVQLLILL